METGKREQMNELSLTWRLIHSKVWRNLQLFPTDRSQHWEKLVQFHENMAVIGTVGPLQLICQQV